MAALASGLTGQIPGMIGILESSMGSQPQRIARMGESEREWFRNAMGILGLQGLTAGQREARAGLREFTQGVPGQSVATQAAMDVFRTQPIAEYFVGLSGFRVRARGHRGSRGAGRATGLRSACATGHTKQICGDASIGGFRGRGLCATDGIAGGGGTAP